MGYCLRCGEISAGDRCRKCRGRSVASIATALDTIGRSNDNNDISKENKLAESGQLPTDIKTGPCPKVSCSTPIIPNRPLAKRQDSSFVNHLPSSPSWANKLTTKRQSIFPRDIQTHDIFETKSSNSKDISLSSSPIKTSSPTSPSSPVPTALVENASDIKIARSGLLKGSTRNSSFFLRNLNRNENEIVKPAFRGIMPGSYSTSTVRSRPQLSTQLFQHDISSANSSTVSSPATPISPTHLTSKANIEGRSPVRATSKVTKDQQKKAPYTINNEPSSSSNKKKEHQQVKKKRICCECNQPLRKTNGKSSSSRRIGVPPAAGSQDDFAWYHHECLRCPICKEHFGEQDYFVRHGQDVYHAICRKSLLNQNNDNKESLEETKSPANDKNRCTTCSTGITLLGPNGDGFEYKANSYHLKCAFVCFDCQKLIQASESQRVETKGKTYCNVCTLKINHDINNNNIIKGENEKANRNISKSPPVSTPRRRRCVSSGAIALTSSSDIGDTTPSDLFRNRTKALPKLGGSKLCPRCKQSVSFFDNTLGPLATQWHKSCLACASCAKRMDSDAKLYKNERDEWLVYCRACTDKRRRSVHNME